jgi:hypothetical protein
MNEAKTYLPSTDDECDERLVKVLAIYILERAMPLKVASQILLSNLRNKDLYMVRFNEVMQFVSNGTT